ncbi:MAG: ADP-ribosylglycohydrolase family protein [Cyanobacteria bacterium]|nr:ADP-ribosylglycohydrolase family protein [Cyanobacteriota bacterium]
MKQAEEFLTQSSLTTADRISGAILGAFIGDALGVGPHWYYNLEALREDHGDWITSYTTPKPGRYHDKLKAGEPSQAGILLKLMLQSLVDKKGYDEADFCHKMDTEFFPLLDGIPASGPGGYTSQSIREAWRRRVELGLPWNQLASHADNTEALERTLILAVRYAFDLNALVTSMKGNTALTQADEAVQAVTVAFGATLALLIQGHPLDTELSDKLFEAVEKDELPFHRVTKKGHQPIQPGEPAPPLAALFASPDALFSPSAAALLAEDPGVSIEPAWKVSLVYGLPCAFYFQLPAVYYLAARFRQDFESAVLHSLNGGGLNLSRTMLTGALVGAQVGVQGIPQRFIEGLSHSANIQLLIEELTRQIQSEG